ncbi:MAG TPA: hypothetical protein VFW65_36995 [Pseudonocardiaceae bacterium]|nr:hypothetical protein [Pseudonocardiaceae bacterium]
MTDDMTGWDHLNAAGGRLQQLYQQGHLEDVLAGVAHCRAVMAEVADPPPTEGTVPAWGVREDILSLGVVAAHGLGRWQEALDLNAAVRQSQEDRRAGEVERAVGWFNDYGPLLRLGKAQAARELLYQCRAAFGRAQDITMMGNTLSALADTDAHLGHYNLSVDQETDALRLKYQGTDAEAIAVSHYNLANYLMRADDHPKAVWAHRLAAAVVRYQINSPRLATSVQSIGRLIGGAEQASRLLSDAGRAVEPTPTRSPMSFNDVCQTVDALPGVRFTELVGVLPSRAESGQAMIEAIMAMIDSARDSAVQESLAAWEPVISAMVVAAQPEADERVASLVDDALDELGKQHAWRELVAVLNRIQAGPDHHSARTIADLDPVSAAVANRAIAALAGEVTVDPTAWQVLVDA